MYFITILWAEQVASFETVHLLFRNTYFITIFESNETKENPARHFILWVLFKNYWNYQQHPHIHNLWQIFHLEFIDRFDFIYRTKCIHLHHFLFLGETKRWFWTLEWIAISIDLKRENTWLIVSVELQFRLQSSGSTKKPNVT